MVSIALVYLSHLLSALLKMLIMVKTDMYMYITDIHVIQRGVTLKYSALKKKDFSHVKRSQPVQNNDWFMIAL